MMSPLPYLVVGALAILDNSKVGSSVEAIFVTSSLFHAQEPYRCVKPPISNEAE
jgi:hypothetical protein